MEQQFSVASLDILLSFETEINATHVSALEHINHDEVGSNDAFCTC